MIQEFNQFNETDRLRKVIIGRHRGYRQNEEYVELVNESQREGLPDANDLEEEFTDFTEELSSNGVEVLIPDYVGKFVYDQLTPRDLGVTIGNRFLICNMARSSRRYEVAGIFSHIRAPDGSEPVVLIPPDPEMRMEGGDIIVDKGYLFVGLTERTNQTGVQYLRETFGDEFEVVPVNCRSSQDPHPVLHLDCIFNPVGEQHALIYPQDMEEIPPEITANYKFIEVDRKAQQALATNVLSVSKQVVISRNHPACRAANQAMREAGLEVITLPFDAAPSTGGSFRCCSLPLVRD